jgi:hypothetical protein
MFEQAFRNIDDVLRKEAGCASELDYIEQTSWLLFLRYLDALEQDKADEAALLGGVETSGNVNSARVGTPALQSEAQRLETIYGQKLAALEVLKKSLLDRAFSGAL